MSAASRLNRGTPFPYDYAAWATPRLRAPPGQEIHMPSHEPLTGPLRGTRGWWEQLGQHVVAEPPPPPKRKRRSTGAPIRAELVERVKREIAAGTYDTPEKWDAALDRLLDHLQE